LSLGALLLSVQDSAAAEEVEQVTQPDVVANDSTTNLLSSGLSFILNNTSLYLTKCTVMSYLLLTPICEFQILKQSWLQALIFYGRDSMLS